MGNKTNLKRLRSFLIRPLIWLLKITKGLKFISALGKGIYEFGLGITLRNLSKVEGVSSIYSKTNFLEDFIPGISDIDLVVITKNLEIKKEIDFLRKIYMSWVFMHAFFPFIAPLQIYSELEFIKHQERNKITRKGKHFSEWSLLFGRENRKCSANAAELSRFNLRSEFENLLLNIYESWAYNENYHRRLYKSAQSIFTADYIKNQSKMRCAGDIQAYLIKRTGDFEFVEEFFNLPKKNYSASKEMQIKTLFHALKILETLFDKVNRINFERKFFCRVPIKNNLRYSYFLTDSQNYQDFRKETIKILEEISGLKDFRNTLDNKPRTRFGVDFQAFPLIVTNILMNTLFLDSIYPFESVAIASSQKQKSCMTLKQLKAAFEEFKDNYMRDRTNSLIHRAWLENKNRKEELVAYAMAYRLLKEKDLVCLQNIESEYKRSFKDINLISNEPEEQYSFIRRIIK